MAGPPKISVLIPTFNCARFLSEAIDSILAQEFRDFELIISDDNSSDGTAELLRRYAAREPRLCLHLQPSNLGMVPNWNWCLQQARGEYIKFVFGDDALVSAQALGRMAACLETEPDIALVASARRVWDQDSHSIATWNELKAAGRHLGAEVIARCLQQDRNLIGEPSAVMFRRAAAGRGFDPRLRQLVDLEMWLHLLSSGHLAYFPESLCAFRLHAQQQSEANRRARIDAEERLLLFSRYLKYLPTDPAGRPRSALERWTLFRCLYYSRNYTDRTSENKIAESALAALLGRNWYRLYWLRHRLTKPFANLARYFRRIFTAA